MELINFFNQNLLSPPILFFSLGIISGFLKSNLEIPNQISRYLAIYLMMSIGFKGGFVISENPVFSNKFILTIFIGISLGFIQPFIGYFLLKKTTRIDNITAAAIAAHYGSISIITFITAVNFLEANSISYSGYIVSIVPLMEVPSILSGLYIAYRIKKKIIINNSYRSYSKLYFIKEAVSNGYILLLTGSFFIGWISGSKGMERMEGFLIVPFQGILSLFLLDMGLLVSKHLSELKEFNIKLFIFGIYMPLIGSLIGIAMSIIIKLDVGTGFLFIVLIASASYIAVTAVMRNALPEAKTSLYLTMSLGITFPFNIIIGIPIYFKLAQKFL